MLGAVGVSRGKETSLLLEIRDLKTDETEHYEDGKIRFKNIWIDQF